MLSVQYISKKSGKAFWGNSWFIGINQLHAAASGSPHAWERHIIHSLYRRNEYLFGMDYALFTTQGDIEKYVFCASLVWLSAWKKIQADSFHLDVKYLKLSLHPSCHITTLLISLSKRNSQATANIARLGVLYHCLVKEKWTKAK